MKTVAPYFDWDVKFGFYPYQRIPCSKDQILEDLVASSTSHVAISSYRGIYYSPAEGNRETIELVTKENQKYQDKGLQLFGVGTFNPQEGLDTVRMCLKELAGNVSILQLYPEEQGWDANHPVFINMIPTIQGIGINVLIYNSSPADTLHCRDLLGDSIALITTPHFYQMSDWMNTYVHKPNLFLSLRFLHGYGALEEVIKVFGVKRMVFTSATPTGSSLSVKNLVELLAQRDSIDFGKELFEQSLKLLEGPSEYVD